MMTVLPSFDAFSDRDLVDEVTRLATSERHATAALVASLAEFDARRLCLGEGCSSLFTYCTQVLHLSEHAAYNRIQAARTSRRFPIVLERLAEGSIHLTAVRLLGPLLTPENHQQLLDAARHKSKQAVEQLVASLQPRPDASTVVRKLPTPVTPHPTADVPHVLAESLPLPESIPLARSAPVVPLAPERYKVQLTVSKETYEKLRRVQDLMRHRIPNGDVAAVFEHALSILLAELERTKLAASKRPRIERLTTSASRHIPAAVKRAVWTRDGGRCAFVGHQGRCRETGLLEFHHVVPYAAGGETRAENLELRCRAHNAYESEKFFGHRGALFAREGRPAWGTHELVPERVRC